MNSRTRNIRPWLVLLGCCMMQGGSLGVIMNTMGLFFTAVSQDMGFTVGGISYYKTIAGLSSCLLLPFVGKVLYRFDTRITLSLSALVMAVCTAMMAHFHQLWQWYASAFFLGIASAMLLSTSEPIILANWFHEKLGLAIGISAAFSGVMGTVCNMAFERVIAAWGWQVGYYTAGIVCLMMILPMTLFVIRLKPEMVGSQPYGRTQESLPAETPLAMDKGMRYLLLTLLCLAAAAPLFCTGFSPQLVNYAASKGQSLQAGALFVSCSMLTNALGKVLLGEINDWKGLKGACIIGVLFGIPAFLLLYSAFFSVMIVGSLLYGAAMSLSVITPPLLTRKFFRGSDYPKAFSLIMMLATFLSSFSTGILGSMYDHSGSYHSSLALCLGLCVVFLALCGVMLGLYRKLSEEKLPI